VYDEVVQLRGKGMRGREVMPRGGSDAVRPVVGIQRVEEEDMVTVRLERGTGVVEMGWESGRDGEDRARDTDCSGGEREIGRWGWSRGRDGGTTLGDWKQLRAVRVGHTVDQSGSPRFGERHGCPTESNPRSLVVFVSHTPFSYSQMHDYPLTCDKTRTKTDSLFVRSLTLLKRPPSNLQPYLEIASPQESE